MKLVITLDELKSLTCQICNAYNTQYWQYEEPEKEYTQEQLKEIWMSQEYRKREIQYPDNDTTEGLRKYYETVEKDEQNIVKCSNNVLKAYSDFRENIKRELII